MDSHELESGRGGAIARAIAALLEVGRDAPDARFEIDAVRLREGCGRSGVAVQEEVAE